jgi:Ca2+-binding RTX toxin-like protein
VAPTAKASGAATAVRNVPYQLFLAATDPSPADTKSKFSYQINWGDGTATTTTATGARTATHNFPTDSTTPFQIKVSALDKDAFVPGAQFTVTVTVSKFGLVSSVSEPGKTDLVVGGTGLADTYSVVRGTNGAVKVLGTGNEQLTNGVSFNGKVRIFGGDGADRITAEPSLDRDLLLFGGAGADTLAGGAGDDVLAGGNDADSLSGLNGRDLLLGEAGQDSLDGGDGEDLLVAGTSKFADDPLAYPGIMKEWTRTGAGTSYAARIERILGPDTGLNTKFTLNKKNITNDFNADSVTGGGGTDAYFADPTHFFAKDVLVGRVAGETLVDLI